MGVWVAVDPAGFQDIVAAKPVLSLGAYLLLAVGIALSLLGFLGCCGALRRSRPLLLVVSGGICVGKQLRDVGSWADRGLRGAGARGMEGVGGCGVSSAEPEAWCSPSCPCQLSTTPPTQSPLCDSFNLEPRGFYKATEQGHFSLRLLACPKWHFQGLPPPPPNGEG